MFSPGKFLRKKLYVITDGFVSFGYCSLCHGQIMGQQAVNSAEELKELPQLLMDDFRLG